MFSRCQILQASSPHYQAPPRSAPLKFIPHMFPNHHHHYLRWYMSKSHIQRHPFRPTYRERNHLDTWPAPKAFWNKGSRTLLETRYSREALKEILEMIPEGFHAADVRRPPQRIKAESHGIVDMWWSNYWTLHSIRYQCFLAGIPWTHGTQGSMRSNYDEPTQYVDYEESKLIRDHRSRWINVHRSLAGMSKKMKDAKEENRYMAYKKTQDQFWSNRKILINRVKAMVSSGTGITAADLPIKTYRLNAFDLE
eukprot:PhF_6_TR13335/c0_g1_i1/m.21129